MVMMLRVKKASAAYRPFALYRSRVLCRPRVLSRPVPARQQHPSRRDVAAAAPAAGRRARFKNYYVLPSAVQWNLIIADVLR